MVGGCVARCGDGLHHRVAELDALAVGERDVLELDPRSLGQIRGRAGALDERREARDVVGLHMGLEDGDDRDSLRLGQRDVVVDQIDMRIDDGEPALRLTPEQVGGTGRLVIEQLAEEHGLTSYQLIC